MKTEDSSKNLRGKKKKPVFSSPSESFAQGMDIAHYQIRERIGRGGMGMVFRAHDTKLHRDVALKLLPSSLLATDEEMARFRREAEAVASIDHPNVVTIYEVGEADEQPYLAMQWIDGPPLSEYKNELTGDSRRAARLMATVARAVHAAHRNGILHRDIKPSNILIDRESGEPYVADFGLAKSLEDSDADSPLTLTGQVLGTPQYMSPEQAAGTNITTASDVYSLGAVFYQLLTGELPIQGNSTADLLRRIAEDAPSRLRFPEGKRDADLEAVVLKCLEKDSSHRYDSSLTFAEDLERWLNHKPVTARPVPPVQRALRWARRKPLHATATGLAGLLVLTLAVGGPLIALKQNALRDDAVQAQGRAEKSEELLRQELYSSEMIQASLALDEPNGRHRVKELVDRWEGDPLCGWESRHFHYRPNQPAEKIETYGRYFSAFALHPDGIHFAASGPGGLRVATKESPDDLLWVLRPEKGKIEEVQFSAKGEYLAARFSSPLQWKIFHTSTGEELLKWQCQVKEAFISWSDIPAVLARFDRSRRVVEVVNIETGKVLREISIAPRRENQFFDWMPDGSGLLLIRQSGKIARVPHSVTHDSEQSETVLIKSTSPQEVRTFSISPNGKWAAIGYDSGSVRVLDIEKQHLSAARDAHQTNVADIAWSPDSQHFTTIGPEAAIPVWNAESFERVSTVFESGMLVRDAYWIDNEHFYSFSGNGEMRLRHLQEADTFRTTGNSPLFGLGWSDDGKRVVAGFEEALVVDTESVPPLVTHSPIPGTPTADIRWMPNGQELAFYHNFKLSVADTVFQNIREFAGYEQTPAPQRISRFPTLPWIAGTASEGIFIANIDKEEIVNTHHNALHRNPIKIALPHPKDDQTVLFYHNVGGEISHLDIETNKVRHFATIDSHQVAGLDFDPDGTTVVAGASDGQIHLFRFPDGEHLATLSGHTAGLTDVDISPDGQRIASASADRTIRIWDLPNREVMAVLSGHQARVRRVSWSPDGNTLASCDEGGQLRIWRTE